MDTLIAWAAGFFDGEGCITVQKKDGVRLGLVAEISNTDPRPLYLLLDYFGGCIRGKWNEPAKALHPTWKPCWTWRVKGTRAQNFLRAIYPYLVVKKEQASLVMNFSGDTWGRKGLKLAVKHELSRMKREILPGPAPEMDFLVKQRRFEL